jgi:hypothetical protein
MHRGDGPHRATRASSNGDKALDFEHRGILRSDTITQPPVIFFCDIFFLITTSHAIVHPRPIRIGNRRWSSAAKNPAAARRPLPDGAWALLRLAPRDRGSPAPHSEAADNGARSRPHRARRAARRATGSAGHRRDAGEVDPLAGYIQLRLGVFSGSISARENLAQDGVARKMAPNVLKRLNLGSEMVWPRTSRSHKMW